MDPRPLPLALAVRVLGHLWQRLQGYLLAQHQWAAERQALQAASALILSAADKEDMGKHPWLWQDDHQRSIHAVHLPVLDSLVRLRLLDVDLVRTGSNIRHYNSNTRLLLLPPAVLAGRQAQQGRPMGRSSLVRFMVPLLELERHRGYVTRLRMVRRL
jgi:hypothetical protein